MTLNKNKMFEPKPKVSRLKLQRRKFTEISTKEDDHETDQVSEDNFE